MTTVKEQYSEKTMSEAVRLLKADTEMLHDYSKDEAMKCVHCGAYIGDGYEDECPALLRAAVAYLLGLIDTPHTKDFMEAVPLEAAHQIKRWGVEHDDGKAPEDWFWLIGYLAGKALHHAKAGNVEKAKHHTISTAACMLNWFRRLAGDDATFRPGIEPPPDSQLVGGPEGATEAAR